jgi:gas vesicle protein
MKKEKFIFTIVFTLLTGVIIGSIVTYLMTKPDSKRLSFAKHHAAGIEKVINQLDLNEEQKKQFYTIHIKHLTRVCSVLKKNKPAIIKIIEEETGEINSTLTPEQQQKFKEIRAKMLNKFKTKFANVELLKHQLPQ